MCRRDIFGTIAICILPDHLQTIWQLSEDDSIFSSRWSLIKSGFAQGIPARQSRSLSKVMKREKDRPAVVELLDVDHEQSGGVETLSFTLIDIAGGGNYFDVIRNNDAQYTLLVLFHRAQRDEQFHRARNAMSSRNEGRVLRLVQNHAALSNRIDAAGNVTAS